VERIKFTQGYFRKIHVQTSANLVCVLPMAVAWSLSGGVAMRYVLPV